MTHLYIKMLCYTNPEYICITKPAYTHIILFQQRLGESSKLTRGEIQNAIDKANEQTLEAIECKYVMCVMGLAIDVSGALRLEWLALIETLIHSQ